MFYHRYRDSPGFVAYDRERDVSYFASFVAIVNMFEQRYSLQQQVSSNILWLHVLTGTVMYAKYVVEGVLPNTPETEENIFQMEMNGLRGLLHTGQSAGPPGGAPGPGQ